MSEKVDWKKEIASIIESKVSEILERKFPPSSDKKPDEHDLKAHWKAEELVSSECPECKRETEKLFKAYLEKMKKERESYPFVCEGCGLGVKKEEEECPLCGSKNADPREE